jgi:alpha-D-xyloside xylohydrolase
MFGKSLLVAPVTEAGAKEWNVYLPKAANWYDFWSGTRFVGGQTVKTIAPLEKMPIFVRAGSILPMGKFMQYVNEKPNDTLEIRVYPGANASFELYEDEGDNYGYEQGKYSVISFVWNEKAQRLSIGNRQGDYPGCLRKRVFQVVFVQEDKGTGLTQAKGKSIRYTGKSVLVRLR